MKRFAAMTVIAMALMLLIGITGSAFSESPATTNSCSASCPKFVDNNKDGICDSMAVHHKDGKCTNMASCMKDGCCAGNCKNHTEMMKKTSQAAVCDPTKCATKSGGCPMKAKASCSGSK